MIICKRYYRQETSVISTVEFPQLEATAGCVPPNTKHEEKLKISLQSVVLENTVAGNGIIVSFEAVFCCGKKRTALQFLNGPPPGVDSNTMLAMIAMGNTQAPNDQQQPSVQSQAQGYPQPIQPQQQQQQQQAYPQQAYAQQPYPTQEVSQQTYPQQANPQQMYAQQAYPQQAHAQQAVPQQAVPPQAIPQQAIPQQAYPQQAYAQQAVPQQAIPQQAYPQQSITDQMYTAYTQMNTAYTQQFLSTAHTAQAHQASHQPVAIVVQGQAIAHSMGAPLVVTSVTVVK
jgi:hypothetical protein